MVHNVFCLNISEEFILPVRKLLWMCIHWIRCKLATILDVRVYPLLICTPSVKPNIFNMDELLSILKLSDAVWVKVYLFVTASYMTLKLVICDFKYVASWYEL